jgi:hypothetical protein
MARARLATGAGSGNLAVARNAGSGNPATANATDAHLD